MNHPGLHDNPWVCDCRLYDLVQFQKLPTLSVALIDTRLRCAAPESLSGVLFSDAELRKCQAPRVHTAVAHVRSAVGNNVLLRCGTIGVPSPDLAWHRAEGKALNGTGESARDLCMFASLPFSLCVCVTVTLQLHYNSLAPLYTSHFFAISVVSMCCSTCCTERVVLKVERSGGEDSLSSIFPYCTILIDYV